MTTPRPARDLAVLEVAPPRRGPDRGPDRRLTSVGLAIAIAFLVAALASVALPVPARLGWWVPLHLVLAGAAGTAVAAMLPFFMAALAVAPPAPLVLRAVAIGLVAAGAVAGIAGRLAAEGGPSALAALGAWAYATGMAAVGVAAAWSLRGSGALRRPATAVAYGVALVDVVLGVGLVGLFLAGDPAVTTGWATLRAAHAWLNVLGFLALAIGGTLIHFVPTVVGARIRRRPAAAASVAFLAAAAPLAATGYAVGPGATGDALVRLGAGSLVLGALALAVHGLQAHRDRVAWTTDHEWHAFTSGSLLAGPGWLVVAAGIAGAQVLEHGSAGRGWRLDLVAEPLVLGFVVQIVLGALAHLLPAVGPGTPAAHAVQRRLLGWLGTGRLLAWNAGVAGLALGALTRQDLLGVLGALLAVGSGATTLALLVRAAASTLRSRG